MSYILDALRKSELERRMRETPSLAPTETDPTEAKNKTKWIFIALALSFLNISALAFWWFSASKNEIEVAAQENTIEPVETSKVPSTDATLQNNTSPRKALESKNNNDKAHIEKKSDRANLDTKQESISDMFAKQQKKSRPRPKPAAINKPKRKAETTIAKVQAMPRTTKKVQAPISQSLARIPTNVINEPRPKKKLSKSEPPYLKPEGKKIEEVAKTAPSPSFEINNDSNTINQSPPKSSPDKRPPPYLHQMSRGFQRTIPKINLNVHMYSPETASSFVIIDMIKFYEGQILGESNIMLEEITADDVILSYEGELFRISAN